MKNIFLLTLLVSSLYLTGCQQKSNSLKEKHTTENSEYNSMSAEEKIEFKNKLIADLKADPDFAILHNLMLSQTINHDKTESVFNDSKQKLQLIMKMTTVIKNHPELAKLDKKTAKEVMKAARN